MEGLHCGRASLNVEFHDTGMGNDLSKSNARVWLALGLTGRDGRAPERIRFGHLSSLKEGGGVGGEYAEEEDEDTESSSSLQEDTSSLTVDDRLRLCVAIITGKETGTEGEKCGVLGTIASWWRTISDS